MIAYIFYSKLKDFALFENAFAQNSQIRYSLLYLKEYLHNETKNKLNKSIIKRIFYVVRSKENRGDIFLPTAR